MNAARAGIARQQLAPGAVAIHTFRHHVFGLPPDSPMKGLPGFTDFYSMSMCRDLIFHVQEHQFRLPQIAAMLHDNGLKLLGWSNNVPQSALTTYRRMFPGDKGGLDFRNWEAFEAQHPSAFMSMYEFLCQLPGQGERVKC